MQDLRKVHVVYPISTDVIKPAFTFARSAGPPGDVPYNIDRGHVAPIIVSLYFPRVRMRA